MYVYRNFSRITNRHKMEDGRQLITISAVSRFTVTKILDLSTDSYTQGNVRRFMTMYYISTSIISFSLFLAEFIHFHRCREEI
jgi:hypothetical protein